MRQSLIFFLSAVGVGTAFQTERQFESDVVDFALFLRGKFGRPEQSNKSGIGPSRVSWGLLISQIKLESRRHFQTTEAARAGVSGRVRAISGDLWTTQLSWDHQRLGRQPGEPPAGSSASYRCHTCTW